MTRDGEVLLATDAVVKRYGTTVALDGVDFDVRAGEVHAVVGENGAGKSTLARVLAGATRADQGALRGTLAGRGRGRRVAMVPQALSLIGVLSLVEHVALAYGAGHFNPAEARELLAGAAAQLGGGPDPDRPTGELSMPEQQLGELGLALALGARVLIVDEPTSSLGPEEVERLVAALRGVAARGGGVVLVTHRIREALGAADRVTVLRAGRRVFRGATAGLDADTLAVHMVGELERRERPAPAVLGPVRLRAAAVGAPPLADVTLEVAGGEIVGIAGVAGGGQEVLAEVLAGVRRPTEGSVTVDGAALGDARAAVAAGVAYIPERRADALVPALSGSDNAVLLALLRDRSLRRRWTGLRDRRAEIRRAAALYERWDVRPRRPELPAVALSGGNQQKLVVGRELTDAPSVVVAHGPTLGLDLRAADAVRHDLRSAAAAGAAVVVLSTDLDEVMTLADRVIVLSGGRITDAFAAREAVDSLRVGRAMAGHATPLEATG